MGDRSNVKYRSRPIVQEDRPRIRQDTHPLGMLDEYGFTYVHKLTGVAL